MTHQIENINKDRNYKKEENENSLINTVMEIINSLEKRN